MKVKSYLISVVRILIALIATLHFFIMSLVANAVNARIKEIVYFEGIRSNILVGYGLVIGLNGTGDNLNNTSFTETSLRSYLTSMGVRGIESANKTFRTKNVAAVMVTGSLPPFARSGNKIDITVSTLGDAKSIKGGILLATPLLAADGEIYALAQGSVSIGIQNTENNRRSRAQLTSGFIKDGAYVEREVDFAMNNMKSIRLALKKPDITTARSIENAINSEMRANICKAIDPGTVEITIPIDYHGKVLKLLADIERLTIKPDKIAKIVIDQATGTIVIGENVMIEKVSVSQGNLVVRVGQNDEYDFLLNNEEEKSLPGTKFANINECVTLNDLVQGLNKLEVKTTDLISILRLIHKAGALHADIVIQ